ncbi:hypothetical protein ABK040_013758 [Willaertia magna]
MKRGSLFFLPLLLSLLLFSLTVIAQESVLQIKPLSSLKKDDVVIGVTNYFYLFTKNSTFNTNLTLFSFNSYIPAINNFLTKSELGHTLLPSINQPIQIYYSYDCFRKSIWDNTDGIISDLKTFEKYIWDNPSEEVIGMHKDFNFISLFPNSFLTVNEKSINQTSTILQEYLVLYNNSFVNYTVISDNSQCVLANQQLLQRIHGIFGFSVNDMNVTSEMVGFPINYTFTYYNQLLNSLNLTNLNLTKNEIVNQLYRCNVCGTETCFSFRNGNYLFFISAGILFFYFLILFTSNTFTKPSIKRRLFIPYLCPIFYLLILFDLSFQSLCPILLALLSCSYAIMIVGIYALTVVRFIYLKNLYKIIQNQKENILKINKILASTGFGLTTTFIIPFIFSSIFFIIGMSYSYSTLGTTIDEDFIPKLNIFLVAISFFGCILGLICVIIDFIMNRSEIKEFGVVKFLFFNDPFYLRLDLMTMTLIIIVLILTAIFSFSPNGPTISILALINTIFIYMASGGNTLSVELFLKVKVLSSKNNIKKELDLQTELENLLDTNKDFYQLFKEYCEKEFSLENLLCFSSILNLKDKEKISTSSLREIYENYVQSLSKYEVNLPNHVRKKFVKLMEDCEMRQEEATKLEFEKTDFLKEVILNLTDTYQRFLTTSYYQKWKSVYEIQKKAAII